MTMNRREAILAGSALAATSAIALPAATANPTALQMMTVWHKGKQVGGCCFQGGDVIQNARNVRAWVSHAHRSELIGGDGMAVEDCEVRLESTHKAEEYLRHCAKAADPAPAKPWEKKPG